MSVTNTATVQWLKEHRTENNRFLASLGVGIIGVAALFALANLASVGVILAWSALAILALALPWTEWIAFWNRDLDASAWERREGTGITRPPIG